MAPAAEKTAAPKSKSRTKSAGDGSALVIVESPTKAKTIRKFLPKNFIVEASVGHVRDLPQSAADIPKDVKDEEWAKIGVNVDKDFEPLYVIPKGKFKVISDLRAKLKNVDMLYLATDEDREGESISAHLIELLKPKVPVKRMVFHEITKAAIEHALTDTREIDQNLVSAQETRRVLDRLVGYTVSPLIWKKIAFGLSAGRVQSSALRMIVDRERERIAFRRAKYWDLQATVAEKGAKDPAKEAFDAKLHSVKGQRIATSKDFDETTGKLLEGKEVLLLDGKESAALLERVKKGEWKVIGIEERPVSSKPSPPFITSTLQQEGNRKLGLSSRETMRLAQQLYEEGLITYMRTDSPTLSTQAVAAAREAVKELYGEKYLPSEPRSYASKDKQAQEAHEAVRPAGSEFTHPDKTGLTGKARDLYELIWMRTVACQMVDAQKKSVTVKIEASDAVFNASGSTITFPGYLRAYVEGSDDPGAALADKETILPPLKQGDVLKLVGVESLEHETQPPARFTEASIVRELEKAGIGRPSTYASIISTLIDRDYVRKNGNALVPSFTGIAVTQLLVKHFNHLVDAKFTSEMERSLDDIAEGKKERLPYLRSFYLGKEGLKAQVAARDKGIDPGESRTLDLPHLTGVDVKIGRYGAYVIQPGQKGAEEVHASIPEDIAPADLTPDKIAEIIEISAQGPKPIGEDPKTKQPIFCLTGRFGPYVQLGPTPELTPEQAKETDKKKIKAMMAELPKPRRASVPKGVDPRAVTIEQALKWLSLPRELGLHPETKTPILANNGRFGPYVQHGTDYRSLKKEDDVYTVSFDRAMELLNTPKQGRASSKVLKELGPHPEDQKPIQLLEGKFGPYVKHKSTSASLPKEQSPDSLTVDQAIELLKARKAMGKKRR
ncbi:MAG: type I DNA topoisomerase [Bdellovibrionales bacterium]|nr:type I DNA topoisomerase [Bdellovibrionales bacterium]